MAAITTDRARAPVDGCAYAIFDTKIGRCALLWRSGLIVGAALPEQSDEALRRLLRRRFPAAEEAVPPPEVTDAIECIARLLAGEDEDFSSVKLDLSAVTDFERRVLEQTRNIARGETCTYGDIAAQIGSPGAARAVGAALGRNPVPIIIPCHRVLAAGGRSGGFSAPGGVTTKLTMLQIERARRTAPPQLFDNLPLAMKPTR